MILKRVLQQSAESAKSTKSAEAAKSANQQKVIKSAALPTSLDVAFLTYIGGRVDPEKKHPSLVSQGHLFQKWQLLDQVDFFGQYIVMFKCSIDLTPEPIYFVINLSICHYFI